MDMTSGCSPSECHPSKHNLSVKLKVLFRMIGCWCDLAFIPATGIDGREGYCFRWRGPGGVAWPGFAMLLGFLR
uniref:Uncharacterized protein n=1 Tax=Zea mays TaxID=4577 RepID=B6TV69_MAIZE|nr:hypothetical protein [Zea mays]